MNEGTVSAKKGADLSARRRKRRVSGLNLLLAVNKPYGEVTRAVDNFVGRVLKDDGVGHIGTLDPAVTGVLVLAVGQGRKLIACIEEGRRKTYSASIAFGTQTDTDDSQGEVIRTAPVPPELYDEAYARRVVEGLVGCARQRPPRFSAIKIDGVRAYDLARAGVEFELPERDIQIYEARLNGIETDGGLRWLCDFVVSPGTYIRSIARDIGYEVGSAAHLGALCRTTAGAVTLDDCVSLEQIQELGPEGVRGVALDPVRVLGHPVYHLTQEELARVGYGTPFVPREGSGYAEDQLVSLVRGTALYGVWRMQGGRLRPHANCPLGVEGVRLSGTGEASPQARTGAGRSVPPASTVGDPAVLVLGAFDGVHVGHRALVGAAVADAHARGIRCVAVTFDPDPAEVVGSNSMGQRLLSIADRRDMLLEQGVDDVMLVPFTPELARCSAPCFVKDVLLQAVRVASVHVGSNFRFGHRGEGTVETLTELGGRLGFEVRSHELVFARGDYVSASRIRSLLHAAKLDEANELLGRSHFVRGKVAHGRGEGTVFGFPTANVVCDVADCMPAEGVYACYVVCDNKAWPAAANVGAPPTFRTDPKPAFLEANLLGFAGDLYDAEVKVVFVKWLRGSRVFDSLEELERVVLENIDWVRKNLGDEALEVSR